jgi:hypothetical protein
LKEKKIRLIYYGLKENIFKKDKDLFLTGSYRLSWHPLSGQALFMAQKDSVIIPGA